jgi:hypothetical protein
MSRFAAASPADGPLHLAVSLVKVEGGLKNFDDGIAPAQKWSKCSPEEKEKQAASVT